MGTVGHLCEGALLDKIGDIVQMLWGICKEQNCHIWENKSGKPCDVFIRTARLQEYRVHNIKMVNVGAGRSRIVHWKAPSLGVYKIDTDGSFDHVSH